MDIHWHCLPFEQLSLQQLYAILRLRQEIFILEQHCPYLDADNKDQAALHLLGLGPDGALLAYARLFAPGTDYPGHAVLGRVITAPAARGFGIGRQLLHACYAAMRAHFAEAPIHISAQAHLKAYYESAGFTVVGTAYLEDGIPHLPMRKPNYAS